MFNQMTEMLNELDNDIEITSENIVNPGKKRKEPLGEVIIKQHPSKHSGHLILYTTSLSQDLIIYYCFRFSTSS